MPLSGPIPEQVLTIVAAVTLFTVMFDLGLGIVLQDFRWVSRHPGLVARGLFCVLIAVPAIALLATKVFDLPRTVEIGILLMAISPGAPVALRRSLDAGGHRGFAPALQILVAMLAVVSMPLTFVLLNAMYAGRATIDPAALAKQVLVAQLLPLTLGVVIRRVWPPAAVWFGARLGRLANALLLVLTILVLVNVWQTVRDAGPLIVFVIALITALALAVGHALGGPEPATRTAVAICSAARNPGLALLVATLNKAPPAIIATVLAYLVVAAFTVLAYVIWQRVAAASTRKAGS